MLENKYRKEHGLNELIWDGCLYESARVRAAEASGYRTAEDVMNAWMFSEGHKKNILKESYTRGSVTVFQAKNDWYFCQHFGY